MREFTAEAQRALRKKKGILSRRSLRLCGEILVFILFGGFLFASEAKPSPGVIVIQVDATEAARRIFHAQLTIPVSAGPLTLYYPKWIPGDHSPTGDIANLVGLKFEAGGKPLAWRRDLADMYAFHLQIPGDTNTIVASLDYVVPSDSSNWTYSTAQRLGLCWWSVLLYPSGYSSDDLTFKASLKLPDGWQYATALTNTREPSNIVGFMPVSLTTLVDSPVIAGAFFTRIPLTSGEGPSEIDLVGEGPETPVLDADLIAKCKKLMLEATTLFGARHYRRYRFLVTLSDAGIHNAIEHHESSDHRYQAQTFSDPDFRLRWLSTLAHELAHSWNGKYRRPAGLATSDYQQPMEGDLLWVYEGLTRYLEYVLAARSGLWSADDFKDGMARLANIELHRPGRTWRPLQDTADSAQVVYEASQQWASWRRSADFYDESGLIWLEVDAILRTQTHGTRSLNDFCLKFFGGENGPPRVNTYTFDDLTAALNQVAPYDWKGYFVSRLNSVQPPDTLAGLKLAGWSLAYSDAQNSVVRARNHVSGLIRLDVFSSLGMTVKEDATIVDVVPGMPAAVAGAAPGMTLVAVNGRKWSESALQSAVKASKDATGPIELLLMNGDTYKTYSLNYHDGEKYPHLQRDPSVPDLLQQIITPLAGAGL